MAIKTDKEIVFLLKEVKKEIKELNKKSETNVNPNVLVGVLFFILVLVVIMGFAILNLPSAEEVAHEIVDGYYLEIVE